MEHILLDIWEHLRSDSASEDLAKILITIAKTTKDVFWCQKKAPILSAWKKRIWDYFILCKLEFSTSLKANSKDYNNFVAVWYPIVQYLETCKALPSNALYKDMIVLV